MDYGARASFLTNLQSARQHMSFSNGNPMEIRPNFHIKLMAQFPPRTSAHPETRWATMAPGPWSLIAGFYKWWFPSTGVSKMVG